MNFFIKFCLWRRDFILKFILKRNFFKILYFILKVAFYFISACTRGHSSPNHLEFERILIANINNDVQTKNFFSLLSLLYYAVGLC